MPSTWEEQLEQHNKEFFDLCQARHEGGEKTYGPLGFLKNDMFQFIYEELADASNYLRYLFIRLRLIEEGLNESGIDMSDGATGEVRETDELPSGPSKFVGVKEVFGLLPREKS